MDPIDTGQPIDMAKVLEEFDNDQEFFNDVFEAFMSEVDRQIGLIRNAIRESDFDTITRQSHTIKGGAANLIAKELSMAASDLEKMGKGKVADGLDNAINRLESAYKSLAQYVGPI
ncbi:MAG: Hpt domain-containing protein [Pseudomonadota bacterium]